MAGKTLSFEVQHYHKDGHIFPISVTANMVSWGDKRVVMTLETGDWRLETVDGGNSWKTLEW